MNTWIWLHVPVAALTVLLVSCIGITHEEVLPPGTLPIQDEESALPREEPRAKGKISQVDIGTLFQLRGEGRVFLVDVRPAFFFSLGHIPGSISLPLKKFDAQFPAVRSEFEAALGADRVIVLYCTNEKCPDGLIA
ncbi:MAG: rhodanese-like domain-containing protein, partial [Verrucomicrobiota bacterium]|nr:rhodanese-like domain-containing protein [Verrucomicrobiota bacterium]